jgi:hypothetical protein
MMSNFDFYRSKAHSGGDAEAETISVGAQPLHQGDTSLLSFKLL